MAVDLQIYTSGRYVAKTSEELDLSQASNPPASGMEVLASKVIKYLLTSKGTDGFNPYYGGTAMQRRQVNRANLMDFQLELQEDIRRCTSYIQSREDSETEYPLSSIILNKLIYFEEDKIPALAVYLTINSTTGDTMPVILKD